MSLDDKLGQLAGHLITLTKKVDDLADHVSTLADQVREVNDSRQPGSDESSEKSSSATSVQATNVVRIRPKELGHFQQCKMQSNHSDWISQTLSQVTEWNEDAAALLTDRTRSVNCDGYCEIDDKDTELSKVLFHKLPASASGRARKVLDLRMREHLRDKTRPHLRRRS